MSDVALPHDIEPHPLTRMYNGKFGIWLFLASEVMLFGALFSTYVLLRVEAAPAKWPVHGSTILNVPLATVNTLVLILSSVTMVMSWAELKMKNFGKAQSRLLVTFLLAGTFLVIKGFEYVPKFSHYQVDLKTPITVNGQSVSRVVGHLEQATPPLTKDHAEQFVIPDEIEIAPDLEKWPEGEGGFSKDVLLTLGLSRPHGEPVKIEGGKDGNIARLTNFGPRHSTFVGIYFTMTGLHGLHIIGGMVVILFFLITGRRMYQKNPEKYINRIECTGLYWHFVDLVWIFLFPTLYLL